MIFGGNHDANCATPPHGCVSTAADSAARQCVCLTAAPAALAPPPVQAAKLFAEHFAAVWERKEGESGLAAQQLHRSEVGPTASGCADVGCCRCLPALPNRCTPEGPT